MTGASIATAAATDALMVHGTVVAIDGGGVLLRGPSGRGKSDLALRLIDAGARLVADDQVLLQRSGMQVLARAPAVLAGLLEIRGVGIVADRRPCPAGRCRAPARAADRDCSRTRSAADRVGPFRSLGRRKIALCLARIGGEGRSGIIGE
jgi:HPr Serine kinase C-terminal domain